MFERGWFCGVDRAAGLARRVNLGRAVRILALLLVASLAGGCFSTFPTDLDSPDDPGSNAPHEDGPDESTQLIVAASTIAVVGALVYLGYRHQVRQQQRR